MTSRRFDLLKAFVLDEISDLYLTVPEITERVIKTGSECGMSIESTEIVEALGSLLETRLAKGFLWTWKAKPSDEIYRLPEPEKTERYRFHVTKKGVKRQLPPDPDWPFDDESVWANAPGKKLVKRSAF